MKGKIKALSKKNQRGQGMTEYIIIVALVAIAAIGVFRIFGDTARNQMAAITQELGGGNGQVQVTAAGTESAKAAASAVIDKDLSSYNKSNK
tara:strand:- start:61941 stop:62216 length:276 start_codon:yes stop_codon:yes gene_type:complete